MADKDAAAAFVMAAMGTRTISDLAELADLDPGTVGDFLSAKRYPQLKNRAKIEKALGLPAGSIHAAALGQAREVVGPSDEGDDLRYQRPPGLTDEAWARIRAEAQDYIDYQLSKAAQER